MDLKFNTQHGITRLILTMLTAQRVICCNFSVAFVLFIARLKV